MILAGVLLKLGGYGFFRSFYFFYSSFVFSKFYLLRLGILGGVIIRFICLRQSDLKCLIAYSSVVHISPVLCALMIINWGG